MSKVQSDQTFTHVGKNLIACVIVWTSWHKHETCRDLPWNIPGLHNQPYFVGLRNKSLFDSLENILWDGEICERIFIWKVTKNWKACLIFAHLVLSMESYMTSCDVTSNDVSVEQHPDFVLDPRLCNTARVDAIHALSTKETAPVSLVGKWLLLTCRQNPRLFNYFPSKIKCVQFF